MVSFLQILGEYPAKDRQVDAPTAPSLVNCGRPLDSRERRLQAAWNSGSSTASWKLLRIARSATFGSLINLITVFRSRS
jgi:hypothetical protein